MFFKDIVIRPRSHIFQGWFPNRGDSFHRLLDAVNLSGLQSIVVQRWEMKRLSFQAVLFALWVGMLRFLNFVKDWAPHQKSKIWPWPKVSFWDIQETLTALMNLMIIGQTSEFDRAFASCLSTYPGSYSTHKHEISGWTIWHFEQIQLQTTGVLSDWFGVSNSKKNLILTTAQADHGNQAHPKPFWPSEAIICPNSHCGVSRCQRWEQCYIQRCQKPTFYRCERKHTNQNQSEHLQHWWSDSLITG